MPRARHEAAHSLIEVQRIAATQAFGAVEATREKYGHKVLCLSVSTYSPFFRLRAN